MATRNKSKEYQKEISKIRKRISRIEKRGYELKKPFEPTGKSISQLRKEYSSQNIYKKFTFTEDGKRYTGTEYRKIERSRAAKKGWETRRELQGLEAEELPISYEEIIMRYLDDLLYKIENWTPQPDWSDKVAYDKERQKDKLLGIVNHLVNTRGKTSVAESINENAEIIYQIANRIMYETYSNNTVYYPPARYYDPSEDYIRIEEALGEGVFSLQDIEKLNENY